MLRKANSALTDSGMEVIWNEWSWEEAVCWQSLAVCRGLCPLPPWSPAEHRDVSSAVSPRACKLKGGSHTVGFGAFLLRCCSFEVAGASPRLGLSLECGLGRPVGPVKPFLQNEFLLKTAKSCRKALTHLVSQLLVMSLCSGQLIICSCGGFEDAKEAGRVKCY